MCFINNQSFHSLLIYISGNYLSPTPVRNQRLRSKKRLAGIFPHIRHLSSPDYPVLRRKQIQKVCLYDTMSEPANYRDAITMFHTQLLCFIRTWSFISAVKGLTTMTIEGGLLSPRILSTENPRQCEIAKRFSETSG